MGHIILEEGIVVDPKNNESKMDWSNSENVTDTIYFVGIAGYYIRFIERFSKITHSITLLQRKNVNFVWSEKCEERFQYLKKLLTSAPVLKIADPKKYFVVWTHACIERLCVFLMQEGYVIFYEPIKLKDHEKNYVAHDLELESIAAHP